MPLRGIRRLDRDSDVPLYFQLASALKAMLEVGTWKAGAHFASEREIEEEFKVSRAVIRPALDLLVGDGAIMRIKGSGAFVAPPRHEVRAEGLVSFWRGDQDERQIKVLSARKRLPDLVVSHFLEIEDRRTPIAHVTAVVDADRPFALLIDSYSSMTYLPWLLSTAQASNRDAEIRGLDNLDLTRATVSIEHTFFGEWEASQVGATAGDPALMGRFVQFGRTRRAKRERPLEFARLIYRADGAQVAFELRRAEGSTKARLTNSANASR